MIFIETNEQLNEQPEEDVKEEIKQEQHELIKIPINLLAEKEGEYQAEVSKENEIKNEYLIAQGDSPLFDQIARINGWQKFVKRIDDIVLVVAKKNPKQEKVLRHILDNGFKYNEVHYTRFGKSASQGKEGITAFVSDKIYDKLYAVTQMDIKIDECVISKYEAQRCLMFSSCTLIEDYIPRIVIIDEYEKTIKDQLIKYIVDDEKEFVDKNTGEKKPYKVRKVEEGKYDIKLSPFDGCGCHEKKFVNKVKDGLGLDYDVAGCQVRLPGIKGYSVYVPFKKIYKEWGIKTITDVYGNKHNIDDIDCIWNTSMFKWHKLFKNEYGDEAWTKYLETLDSYKVKLGISKYSHHVKNLNRYTRMNFQYLQCLDLWNPKYVEMYNSHNFKNYDILDKNNEGKIISLAKYTTDLYEKIIKGDKFYTYKFMGIDDRDSYKPRSEYLKAALVNDVMLKDPAVKQFIYRKLKKSIDEAKVGKIYCSGFYHTGVGDMVGYLQYAAGLEPTGCLKEHELYCRNFDCGKIASFRSPLVDPSEVNCANIVKPDTVKDWFDSFQDQDIVMFNMYDISAPQQGGANLNKLAPHTVMYGYCYKLAV